LVISNLIYKWLNNFFFVSRFFLKIIFRNLSRNIIIIYNYRSVIIVFSFVETAPTSKHRSPLIFAKEKVRMAEN